MKTKEEKKNFFKRKKQSYTLYTPSNFICNCQKLTKMGKHLT